MAEQRGAADPVRGMVRQGDVLLVPVDGVLETPAAEPAAETEIVLALGEQTGHAHVLRGRARTTSTATASYVVVEGPALLVHDEHDTISLAPGAYEVRRQREWTDEDTGRTGSQTRWVGD